MLDKMRDYNSRMTRWHSNREVMVNTFDRHDFAFKWSYAEMAPLIAGLGFDWAIEQTAKCIGELVDLARPDIDVKAARKNGAASLWSDGAYRPPPVTVTCGSADQLDHLEDGSVDVVVMDPPYYDNVMYAELSDFFYVWLKRTAGLIHPELFTRPLTDKDREAVANPMRFAGQKGAKALATVDYQERMADVFREMRRVLKPDGVMTLMFTHKASGAWDALTAGLMTAGFVITASWPINTEAQGSLHIREKSAANSTIFLVCRPRAERAAGDATVYWEDLEPQVRSAVRARYAEFKAVGIGGVDLYLACFGPALEVFSRHWPVERGRPRPEPVGTGRRTKAAGAAPPDPYAVVPEDALEAARREVKALRLNELTNRTRKTEIDPLTDWFILAWDAFKGTKFPFDEALQLARVVGLDMDRQLIGRAAQKQGGDILLWDSGTRIAKGGIGPPDGSQSILDALHHAAHLGRTRTLQAALDQLRETGLAADPAFLGALEALLEVLPASQRYTGIDPVDAARPFAGDFEALEGLRRLAFTDQVDEPEQLRLWVETAA